VSTVECPQSARGSKSLPKPARAKAKTAASPRSPARRLGHRSRLPGCLSRLVARSETRTNTAMARPRRPDLTIALPFSPYAHANLVCAAAAAHTDKSLRPRLPACALALPRPPHRVRRLGWLWLCFPHLSLSLSLSLSSLISKLSHTHHTLLSLSTYKVGKNSTPKRKAHTTHLLLHPLAVFPSQQIDLAANKREG